MRTTFPLFQTHLDLAHQWWKKLLQTGDIVVDATCGNGKDTVMLARLVTPKDQSTKSLVFAIDIQEKALISAKEYANKELTILQQETIFWVHGSHATFPKQLQQESVKAIIYNLGYLPGGDKALTTKVDTTIASLEAAVALLEPGGILSITCYPGHSEGKKEEQAVIDWAKALSPTQWSCCQHQWFNRKSAPSLLLVQKKIIFLLDKNFPVF